MSWVTFHIAVDTCAPAHPIPVSQEWLSRFRSNLLCICRPISCELITSHGWGVCLVVWVVGGLGVLRIGRLAVSVVGGFGGWRFRWLAVYMYMCFMFESLMLILHGFKIRSELASITPIAFDDFKYT